MKRSYKYFLSLLFIMTAIPFLCIAQTPKKLKKADVLVRSDKPYLKTTLGTISETNTSILRLRTGTVNTITIAMMLDRNNGG